MRILLIEDDSVVAQSIEAMLKPEGHAVFSTDDGEEGLDLAKLYDYDCILLDLELPGMHGLDALKAMRVAKVQTPVLIISGRAAESDVRVKGLNTGADDVLPKPFNRLELLARITALVRRSQGHAAPEIRIGCLTVDLAQKVLYADRGDGPHRVHLTGKEYAMMELFALRSGTTLTKENFLNHLYGGMDEPELKIIDVFVCKLRKKIAAATGGENYIDTVWGRGYCLRAPAKQELAVAEAA